METTPSKQCPRCGETKPLTEFHRNRRNKDGLQSRCKPCHVAGVVETQRRHRDTFRLRQQRYHQSEKGKESRVKSARRYRANPENKAKIKARKQTPEGREAQRRERQSEAYKRSQQRYHERAIAAGISMARAAVGNAIKRGELPRAKTLPCSHCGKPAFSYHHHLGYEREHHLHVIPLCTPCHIAADRPTSNGQR